MIKTTRAQRESLLHIYKWHEIEGTYREFRKRLHLELCGYGAVMIQVGSMWIGIEKDGYAHT